MLSKKFKLKKDESFGEIIALYPKGQAFSIHTNGEEYYSIIYNGYKGLINAELANVLLDFISDEIKEEEVVADVIEDVVIEKKVRKPRAKKAGENNGEN